jgi:hypothetical protein
MMWGGNSGLDQNAVYQHWGRDNLSVMVKRVLVSIPP